MHLPDQHVQASVDIESKEFIDFISTEYGYITAVLDPKPDPDSEFEWHDLQLAIFNTPGSTICNKCRQSGGSFAYSARAFARATLINRDWAIIITSIKKDEAQNKIAYIDSFIDAMPAKYRRTIKYRTKQSIEFANSDKTTAKVISHAQKPSRGLHGDALYDEADFYVDFDLIFEAGQPGTRKVGGRTDIVSTPFNPFGLFRRIIDPAGFHGSNSSKSEEFKEFTRFKASWWVIPFYCHDIATAVVQAPGMDTVDRVEAFGTEMLKQAYYNAPSEDSFKQEYEAMFVERISNFLAPSLVMKCVVRDMEEIFHEDFSMHWSKGRRGDDDDDDGKIPLSKIEKLLIENKLYPKTFGSPSKIESIDELVSAVKRGLVSPNLYMGIDIGTSGHATDIVIHEDVSIDGVSYMIERFWLSINGWELPDQQDYIEKRILDRLPIVKFGIDTNGIGMSMGQYFNRVCPNRFEDFPIDSNGQTRAFMALRSRIDTQSIGISSYDDVVKSLTSIRYERQFGGKSKWIIPKKKNDHCDAAISRAMCAALVNESTSYRLLEPEKMKSSRERNEKFEQLAQQTRDVNLNIGNSQTPKMLKNSVSKDMLRRGTQIDRFKRKLDKSGAAMPNRLFNELK